jgi:DNA-binding CsgD family transcriptional regulator
MLETIREFAVEQLVALGERDPSRRHAEYFAALAEGVEPAFWGDVPGGRQDAIGLEEGNLEAAQTWATRTGETDLALRLASSGFDRHLGSYFRFTSGTDAQSNRQRVRSALVMPGGAPANRVRALTAAAWIVGYADDYAESLTLAAEALGLARAHEDQFGVASALLALGAARLQRGDIEAARVPLSDALAGFRALNLPGRCARTLTFLASLDARDAIDEGGRAEDLARATSLAEEALAIFRTVDVPSGISRALHVLAYIAFKQRDLPRALALTQEVLASDWSRRWAIFTYLEDIADIAGRTGQAEIAARLYGAAEAQRERAGQPVQPLYRAEFERDADVARRALGDVAFAEAWERGKQQPLEDVVAEALALRAEPPSPPVRLTRRETEVVRLLAAGLSDAAIAEVLFLSVRTVESHVARAFARLGVRSRADAIEMARDLGLSESGTRTEEGGE